MRRSSFTVEQIMRILCEQETGQRAADVCLCHGVSKAMLDNAMVKNINSKSVVF
ncbi:MAG: hypothetical protein NUV50_02115 [Rhodospirillales bacterium]|nr:hypothetical protein [Rhodospirillales bacterium]